MKSGIYEIPADQYHEDQIADVPSLSRSIAHLLCTASPAHARTAHPRLNGAYEKEERETFDLGSAAHELFLGGLERVEIIEAADWRTNLAKEARDAARAEGRLPLLAKQWVATQAMVLRLRGQIEDLNVDPPLFTAGKPEQSLVWEEAGGVVCRARPDWLRDDFSVIDDLKTTRNTANPESWSRSLFGSGYDLQAAFYLRGLDAITGKQAEFRFVVVEAFPPFALSVISLAPDTLTLARKKVEYAIDLWRACLRTDDWPAYPTRVCFAELPSFEEARWLAKEERELESV